MRDDYKMQGPLKKVEAEVEQEVAETLQAMAKHTQLSLGELLNTALKRFIVSHKDFLPPRN